MGAAERVAQWADEGAGAGDFEFTGAVPRVSYEDWADVGAAEPDTRWCVDDGASIACLTSRELWDAVTAGRVSTEVRVWREGFGHWHALGEILDAEERVTVPERSEIRVRAQPLRTMPCELGPELRRGLHPLRALRAALRGAWRGWRGLGRKLRDAAPTPWMAACAGVVVGAAAALSLWCALATWHDAHPPVVSPLERSP